MRADEDLVVESEELEPVRPQPSTVYIAVLGNEGKRSNSPESRR